MRTPFIFALGLIVPMAMSLILMTVVTAVDQPPEIIELIPMSSVISVSDERDETQIIVLSTDPDGTGDTTRVSWTVLGYPDLIWQNSANPHIALFSAPWPGHYQVRVTVTDRFGKTDTETVTIYVR